MGTGYTTLDPSRRKVPPPIDINDDEASTGWETDVGEGSSSAHIRPCVTDPSGAGGTGFHYGNVTLIDL